MTAPPIFVATTAALTLVAVAPIAAQTRDRIEGTVVDVLGEPIPRAQIVVEIRGHEPIRTMCDALGRFAAAHLPRGVFNVTAFADGHCANSEYVEREDDALDASVRIELLDAVPVEGRVVDAAGTPLVRAHVLVDARWKHLHESETHAVTDAAGRYRLPNVPAGDVRLVVLAENHTIAVESFTVHRPETRDFTLDAAGSATYRLTVHGADDCDWQRMRVHCSHGQSANNANWQFAEIWPWTRDGDTVVLADVPLALGLSSIDLRWPDSRARASWDPLPGIAGVHAFATTIWHDRPQATPVVVKGSVRDVDGRPMAGLRIGQFTWRVSDETETGPDGTFELATSVAKDGGFWLRLADKRDYLIRDNDRDVFSRGTYAGRPTAGHVHQIVVDRAARVTGSVADANGAPVFGAAVELLVNELQHRGTGDPRTAIARTRTRRDGSFALPRLDGHLDLDAWLTVSCTAGRLHHGPLQLRPGGLVALGTLELPRPGTIEGTYVDEEGRPQPGLSILLRQESELRLPTTHWWGNTDRDGRFRFIGLPSGNYCVRLVEHPAARWAPAPDFALVALKAGERVVVRRGDDLR